MKLLIEIPTYVKCVATLPCEMLKTEKLANLNQISCLTINQIFNELHEPYPIRS